MKKGLISIPTENGLYYNKFMFKLESFMGKRVLKSSLIDEKNVAAFFTTRDLPLKAGERKDMIDEVEQNKKLVCEGLNIPLENLVIPVQTHSDNVGIVMEKGKREKEKENNNEPYSPIHPFTYSPFENTDALVTNKPNIALALNFADCTPIIFYDPIKKVVAIAHAGWRGTVAKIGPKTVAKMVENFDCNPKDIIALIGPCIGKCCFEVGEDVLQKLIDSVDGKIENAISGRKADLKLVNKIQLLASGLEKIDLSEYCTSCQSELFFSYRKEKGNTARHSAVIMLNKEETK